MAGPFPLTEENVRRHARPAWPGVYILHSSRAGRPGYVGRSDSSVQNRLLGYAWRKEAPYFTVEHYRDPLEAWQREAHLFHYHRSSISNKAHPNPPKGHSCPKCDQFDR